MSTRTQNEKKFGQWEKLPDGGRRYWRDVIGRQGRRARDLKEMDANETTLRFWQEIYDEEYKLVEIGDQPAAVPEAAVAVLQALLKRDLIDTLRIWQFPVVVGTGKRLFGERTIPRSFQLVDSQLNTTGAVLHVYERAGELKYGEVEVGQETVIFDTVPTHE